jgi:hypothetical protein
MLVAVIAAFIGVGQWRNAQRERLTRIVQETQQEMLQSQQLQELRSAFNSMTVTGNTLSNGPRVASSVLVNGLLAQWAFGPNYFSNINKMPEAWAERIQLGRSTLDNSPQSSPSIEALFWETSLAFWLLSSAKPDEALPVIQRNRIAWNRLLASTNPNDPWLDELSALESCAVVQLQLAAQRAGETIDHGQLQRAEADLRREDTVFGHTRDSTTGPHFAPPSEGSALHQLVLRTLIDLYGSPLAASHSLRDNYLKRLSNYIPERRPRAVRAGNTQASAPAAPAPGEMAGK